MDYLARKEATLELESIVRKERKDLTFKEYSLQYSKLP